MAGIKVITPPATEPVTLSEVKLQLRIDSSDTDYDDQVTALITAAREWCESYQNRSYIEQTLELSLEDWPCHNYIELPRPPLRSVTSVKYTDSAGTETTWDPSNYAVDDYAFIPRIVRGYAIYWPAVSLATSNAVKVRYVAGYEPGVTDPAENVPQRVKQAIILLVSHWFDNGMCEPPAAVLALLSMDRVVPV